MTRVLHVTNTDIVVDNRILKQMSAHANDGGYVVHGIGMRFAGPKSVPGDQLGATIETLDIRSACWTWLPKILRYPFVVIELLVRATRRGLAFGPDIVQCHDTMALPVGVAMKLLRGCTVVYDAHELESEKNGTPAAVSRAILVIERMCWSRVDALITVSPSIAQWYADHLGPKDTAIVLNSPHFEPGSARADEPKRYFRELFGIPDEAVIFIYVGYLGIGRGIEKLVSVFGRPGTAAHIVFMGYGDLDGWLRARAAECVNIHVHDAVPHEKVVPTARSADVGVCLIDAASLSDHYCLPNKLFEYTFAGLPVLASALPDIKQVVERYSLGMCTDHEEGAIAEAVSRISAMPMQRVTGDLEALSWAAQVRNLLALYSRLEVRR